MSLNPVKHPGYWLIIFLPVIWYTSNLSSSTLDIQLYDTYYVISNHFLALLLVIYLAVCAVIYLIVGSARLTGWMTLLHLVVSILFGTFFLYSAVIDSGVPRRYYSGVSEDMLLPMYEFYLYKLLLMPGIFLLAQVVFCINIWRARRMQ